MKKCTKCQQTKSSDQFYTGRAYKDGLKSQCKACYSRQASERGKKRRAGYSKNPATIPDSKVCSECRETKDNSEFYRNRTTKDGLASWCKPCYKKPARKYYLRYSEGKVEKRNQRTEPDCVEKQCRKCQETKARDEFYSNHSAKDGLKSWCKDCCKRLQQEVYLSSPDGKKAKRRLPRATTGPDEKQCSKCREIKPHKEFHRHRAAKDGLASRCKTCRRSACMKELSAEQKSLVRKAYKDVFDAVEDCVILPARELECAKCGNPAWGYLYQSYVNPLDNILPFCAACHRTAERHPHLFGDHS